jgi:Exostosin family
VTNAAVARHRFLVCRPSRPVIEWSPPEPTSETGHDVGYFGSVFAAAADALPQSTNPLTFVLTWDVRALPELGTHVVAVVQGDEDARIPYWSDQVLITFKCYGTRPPFRPIYGRPDLTSALELAHFVRRILRWIPGAARYGFGIVRHSRRRPIYPVPLGYYNQSPPAPVAFAQRKWSVSFAGSGLERLDDGGWRAKLGTPRDRTRDGMRIALNELATAAPDDPIALLTQPTFPRLFPGQDREALGTTATYSEMLSNTRFCLVPRGYSPETFRFFEAIRAGCIVICEWLPDHWFYRDAPVITLRRWSDLSEVLLPLLADPDAQQRLHLSTVKYWESRCSERALGAYMAKQIALAASG